MTNAATSIVDNSVTGQVAAKRAPRYTEIDRQKETSLFQPSILGTTIETSNTPQRAFQTARVEAIPSLNRVQSVPGVVAEVRAETVVIQCNISAKIVELNLPPALVPTELQAFGRTVSISLDYSGGYQRPVVEAREPTALQELLSDEADTNAWLSQL